MAVVQGCSLPDELLYDVDNHIWFQEQGDGTVKIGMTTVATAMAGQLVPGFGEPAFILRHRFGDSPAVDQEFGESIPRHRGRHPGRWPWRPLPRAPWRRPGAPAG